MILIVGASGRLGSAVAGRLLGQGRSVRVLVRYPQSAARLQQQGAEVTPGDLRDPASLRRACEGVEQVVAAAHALNGKGHNNPHTVDDAGNRHLIDAARAVGVRHFVFVSAHGAGPQAPLEFFRIKYGVEAYLRASGMGYTVVRPSAFMDLWAQMVGGPVLEKGEATIFGHGTNPVNFVAVDDVANFVCAALADPRARNRTIEVGGPEDLTFNQVVSLFERLGGRPARARHIPTAMMRAMAVLTRPVNPTLSRLIGTSIYMDSANQHCEMGETLALFPLPLTSFEDWIREHYRPGQ